MKTSYFLMTKVYYDINVVSREVRIHSRAFVNQTPSIVPRPVHYQLSSGLPFRAVKIATIYHNKVNMLETNYFQFQRPT